MAAKLVASETNLVYAASSYPSKLKGRVLPCKQAWPTRRCISSKRVFGGVVSSLVDPLSSSSSALAHQLISHVPSSSLFLLADSTGYSLASYYTSLGLFVISVPGLWSLIKRSVKSKVFLVYALFAYTILSLSTTFRLEVKGFHLHSH